jgi:hypothetical protein
MGRGALTGFALAARWLAEGINPYRMGARASSPGSPRFRR